MLLNPADSLLLIIDLQMAAFEWVGSAAAPQFKAISALVR